MQRLKKFLNQRGICVVKYGGILVQIAGGQSGAIGVILGSLTWIAMGIVALKMVLKCKYKDFNIALIAREQQPDENLHE